MHLAQWVDEEIDDQRKAGSQTPVQDARKEAYRMKYGDILPNPSELDTLQKYVKEGRKGLRAARRVSPRTEN